MVVGSRIIGYDRHFEHKQLDAIKTDKFIDMVLGVQFGVQPVGIGAYMY